MLMLNAYNKDNQICLESNKRVGLTYHSAIPPLLQRKHKVMCIRYLRNVCKIN